MKLLSWSILGIGLTVRAGLVFYIEPMLDCDEAPQAYMAQLISRGQIWPLVHFQLPYIGALEQYPLALLMYAFGDSIATVNVFYFGLSATSICYARLVYARLFPEVWANLALALFALGHPIVLFMSLQGYSFGGLVFFETIVLWLLVRGVDYRFGRVGLAGLGLLNGLALYNNVLFAGVLFLSALWLWQRKDTGDRLAFAAGCAIGYAPMLAFNIGNDFLSYQLMAAKFLGITRVMVDEQGVLGAIGAGLANKLTGQGSPTIFHILYSYPRFFLEPVGQAIQSLGLTVIAAVCLWSFVCRARRVLAAQGKRERLARDFDLALYLAIVLLAVTGSGEVRYLTSLMAFMPIVFCHGLIALPKRVRSLAPAFAVVPIIYLGVAHTMVFAYADPVDGNKNHGDVIDFLDRQGLRHGYGTYCFQAYAAFTTGSRIKISPQIGPVYLDKIPSFSVEVDRQRDVFYILPNSEDYLEVLKNREVNYQSKRIGNWVVVWGMNKRLFPLDLLSETELAKNNGYYRWSYRTNPAVMDPYRGGH